MKKLAMMMAVAVLALVGTTVSGSALNGITFNDDYAADSGYVAYIQPYDSENMFHSLPSQQIEQYGDPGDAPVGPWDQGQAFNFDYGKAFGGGETKSWAAQNYVVTYWWDTPGYVPVNGPGGDIYIYQPDDGVRAMGILYKGEWKLFNAGTNGLSDTRGDDFWWNLGDAGVAQGDTIEGLAWWCNALGFPALTIEKEFPDNHKEVFAGPSALDMDGDGATEALTFPGGGTSMSYHDPFYMGVGNALWVPEPATMSLLAIGGLGALIRKRRK